VTDKIQHPAPTIIIVSRNIKKKKKHLKSTIHTTWKQIVTATAIWYRIHKWILPEPENN